MTNLCKAIQCPYFNSASEGFGCQYYQNSASLCHLVNPASHAFLRIKYSVYKQIVATQYALYLETDNQEALTFLKTSNNAWLSADEKYKDDLAFVESHQDWFSKNEWRVSPIIQ